MNTIDSYGLSYTLLLDITGYIYIYIYNKVVVVVVCLSVWFVVCVIVSVDNERNIEVS